MIKAPEIESALLGKSLESSDACVMMLSLAEPEDFADPDNQIIFGHIQELFKSKAPVSGASLRNRLNGQAHLVADLEQAAKGVKDEGVELACKYLKKYSKAREFMRLCTKYREEAKQFGPQSEQLFSQAGTDFFNLLADRDEEKEVRLEQVLDEEIDNLTKPVKGGILTGLDLDKITNGFRPGNFVVIAGKTSHGKSSFVHHLLLEVARQVPAAIVSMEMTRSEIIERMISNISGVDYEDVRQRRLSREQYQTITEQKEALRERNLTIIDRGSVSKEKLYAVARRLKLQQDIGLLVVDYLQQVQSEGETREREVSGVVEMLKRIAQDMDIAVIGLSQFNRRASDHQRPQLHHLRESGAIEQYANTAILMWNPTVDGVKTFPEGDEKWGGQSTENVVEFHVAKNRGGKTGSIKIGFDGSRQRFYNLAKSPTDYL